MRFFRDLGFSSATAGFVAVVAGSVALFVQQYARSPAVRRP